MKVKSFLKNKYVLYFATILAILNLVKYISINDLDSTMLCIILFVLSRYFSKLLAFNILFALSVTYLVSMNNFITEGYTERKEEEKNTTEKMTTKKKEKKCKDCPDDKCVDGKCVSTFKNNVPSSTPSSVDGHIDKDSTAAKMEGAFNDLANLLGEDGVSSVSKETKNLIEQQQNLMGTLNDMAPALKDARETLDNMNLPSMDDMTKLFKKINKK